MIEAHPEQSSITKLSDKQFTELLTKNRRHVFNVIYCKTTGIVYEEIQDLVQDVVLKAWINRHRFVLTTPASFRTWLTKITSNVLIDRIRRVNSGNNKPQGGLLSMDRAFQDEENENTLYSLVVDDTQHLCKTIEEKELLSDIEQYIQQCVKPTSPKLIAFQKDVQGLNYQEISKETGQSYYTTKGNIYQFRKVIKSRFGHRWAELYQ